MVERRDEAEVTICRLDATDSALGGVGAGVGNPPSWLVSRPISALPALAVRRPTNICSIIGRIWAPKGVDMISEGWERM